MRIVKSSAVADAVKKLFAETNVFLGDDVKRSIAAAREAETFPGAKHSLDLIIENFSIAEREHIPVCQDTGLACVFVDIGEDVYIENDGAGNLNEAIDRGIAAACKESYLRASAAADPLRRTNTGDNTPAMTHIEIVRGGRVTITVVPKGAGSENMSRIAMLKPSDGREGVIDFVTAAVRDAGPNPCPPLVVGVGLGGNFDKAALLAKKALLRPLGKGHPDPFYAALEEELLRRLNDLGIGPEGFGGDTTALSAAVETMPCHIASLPCAVNISCHVCRRKEIVL